MNGRTGIFITGTDTGVGKTVVSSALMAASGPFGEWGYWKPVQTGDDDDAATVRASTPPAAQARVMNAGYHFAEPASPHHAAALEDRRIGVAELTESWAALPPRKWLVEGAGGWMVPLNDDELWSDLVDTLSLPVLLVASTRLGCINHTLLSLAAIGRRAIGIVMVGPHNRSAWTGISTHSDVPIVGHLEHVEALTSATIAKWGADLWEGDCGRVMFQSLGVARSGG